jgi:UDP-3-O-[3-hydroxymyristoyl] glucosamine N-acyltransferase
MRLGELAQALGAELHGGTDSGISPHAVEITGVAGLENAGPQQVSFLDNPRYTSAAHLTRAAAVLVDPAFPALHVPTLKIRNPYLAFARAVELFHKAPRYDPGLHPTAVVNPSAQLAPDVHVGPYVVIGPGVRVGAGSVLLAHTVLYENAQAGAHFFAHAHAVVREGCILGDHVTLGNGVVVGSDGFGFAKDEEGGWHKIPQSGRVVVGDWVEIQANSCIDRASIGETTIAGGAKIDNLVQVGHGSSVGEHTLLCSQVGLAGSSRIGKNVILAGQVGVAGHLSIGDGAIATAQTGIPNDVGARETVSGYPAIANRQWLRASAAFARLPEILRRLGRLERLLTGPEVGSQAEAQETLHRE